MELGSKMRWAAVIFITLLVVVFVGWGLVSIARNLFSGGRNTTDSSEITTLDPEDINTVRFTVGGPIVASSEHRSYEIEVSRNVVSMKLYSDYGQNIITERSFRNTEEGFVNLIGALDKMNADARRSGTNADDDFSEDGACPTGKRYVLEIDESIRRWSTSCDNVRGNASITYRRVRDLFNKQVPDYKDILKGTGLSN